jgi:hypothetical protein
MAPVNNFHSGQSVVDWRKRPFNRAKIVYFQPKNRHVRPIPPTPKAGCFPPMPPLAHGVHPTVSRFLNHSFYTVFERAALRL